mmetsp:Transcript_34257/g.109414  ORF Transcript_34257/g.109414 Transcript_34257/m.109414 type:complete len:280 (+) Transcript_34257:160-999(+)
MVATEPEARRGHARQRPPAACRPLKARLPDALASTARRHKQLSHQRRDRRESGTSKPLREGDAGGDGTPCRRRRRRLHLFGREWHRGRAWAQLRTGGIESIRRRRTAGAAPQQGHSVPRPPHRNRHPTPRTLPALGRCARRSGGGLSRGEGGRCGGLPLLTRVEVEAVVASGAVALPRSSGPLLGREPEGERRFGHGEERQPGRTRVRQKKHVHAPLRRELLCVEPANLPPVLLCQSLEPSLFRRPTHASQRHHPQPPARLARRHTSGQRSQGGIWGLE